MLNLEFDNIKKSNYVNLVKFYYYFIILLCKYFMGYVKCYEVESTIFSLGSCLL